MISRDGMFNAVWLATAPPTYLPTAASSARTWCVCAVCLFVRGIIYGQPGRSVVQSCDRNI